MMSISPGEILGVSPYLYYEDAAQALDWLTATFGFSEEVRYLDEHGDVMEAELLAGPVRIMVAGGRPPEPSRGRGQLLVVYVDDVDAHHRHVMTTGLVVDPPQDMAYGARVYDVTDPSGYRWTFWQQTGEPQLPGGWRAIRP